MIAVPDSYQEYSTSRQIFIAQLDASIADVAQLDVSEDEKTASQYAVIAWSDEIILCSSLSWRSFWQNDLLQKKYLGVTVAGAGFFTQLQNLDVSHIQARRVFLFCLQNGFYGKYSNSKGNTSLLGLIEALRNQCFPDEWVNWPCNARITPDSLDKFILKMTPQVHFLIYTCLSVFIFYVIVFMLLYHYIG